MLYDVGILVAAVCIILIFNFTIVCILNMHQMQEAKISEEKLTKEFCLLDGFQSFWAFSRAKKGYSGVTTYANNKWSPTHCEPDFLSRYHKFSMENDAESGIHEDADSRVLAWQNEGRILMTDHKAFILINVYVPNAGERPERPRLQSKIEFLTALRYYCEDLIEQGREIMLVGDFNVCSDERDVHPNISLRETYSKEEQDAFNALLFNSRLRMLDTWRHLHPDKKEVYTVWNEKTSARAFNQGLRIDYVLVTPGLIDKIKFCEILGTETLPAKWSDHAGILVELNDVEAPPKHSPCLHWRNLEKKFLDRSQRSIAQFFGKPSKKRILEGDGRDNQSKFRNISKDP